MGKGDGQFTEVEHMTTDKFNNIYVNDPQSGVNGSGMPRVEKFDTDGHFITKFGSLGSGNGQFVDPEHNAVDSDGNVYITDRKATIYRNSNLKTKIQSAIFPSYLFFLPLDKYSLKRQNLRIQNL